MIQISGQGLGRLFFSIASTFLFLTANAQSGKLFLWQHGDTVWPSNGLFEVERDYFELRTTLGEFDKLLINISPDSLNAVDARNASGLLDLNWFSNGTGLTSTPDNRVNWLLVTKKDYTIWSRNSGFVPGKLYTDSLAADGAHLKRVITSFAFYNSGGLDGAYSVFLVPTSRLYLTYILLSTEPGKDTILKMVDSLTIRLMGN
ncbi:MAG: hypothetical protein H6606_07205 [Flavobacteriales bacterium]|nr:hypothetical protein [Flavobacteriales bacterium]